MWFRNLQIYRLEQPFELSAEELHERLGEKPSRPCGALETATLGWSAPLGRHGELLTHAVGRCVMFCARREEKVLPAAVVRELLAERVAGIEENEQRKVRRREQAELKERLLTELLPQAFSRSALTFAYIDAGNGWLVVDAASPKRAEELIGLLRDTLGSLPVRPIEVADAPAAVMTRWLQGAQPPQTFRILDECELRDPVEEGGIVRCRRQDLSSAEIEAHLKAGKQAVMLALEWHERIGFLLTAELQVKRLKFLDAVIEEAADSEAEGPVERFDVDFALMSGELGRFIPQLLDLFGGAAGD